MKKIVPLCLAASTVLFADKGVHIKTVLEEQQEPVKQAPWFTGPLLSPSSHVVPAPHVNYEPYVFASQSTSSYNSHWNTVSHPTSDTILTQGTFQIGVTSFMEFDIAPDFSYNKRGKEHDWKVNDFPIAIGFQLLSDTTKQAWYPAIKLRIGANVPIGKYQHLDPKKEGTDVSGSGDWNPNIGFVLGRLFHFTGIHFLAVRYYIAYGIPNPVHVRGLSAYGGTPHTRGTVYPGNTLNNLLGLEFSLTQRWALACDFQYQHSNKNRFSGHSGGSAPIAPSSEQASIAPAIEYNWSSNVGLITGSWFTVAGRNSSQFVQWVIALNVYV